MADGWEKRKKALEEDYFQRKDAEALERFTQAKSDKPRISPVSGQPMEKKVLHGVVIDQCPVSGGIWLDKGELEQLVEIMKKEETTALERILSGMLSNFTGRK